MKNIISSRHKISILSVILIICLVGVDQLIKYFIDIYLKPVGSKLIIPHILQLSYYENDGAMMGMMGGKTALMTIFAGIFLVLVCFVLYTGKLGFGLDFWCVVFITAGGVGNIIDRLFRGYVIDYIEVLFVDFYIFNFADCLVTCGAFVIIFSQIYQLTKEAKNNKNKKEKATDD